MDGKGESQSPSIHQIFALTGPYGASIHPSDLALTLPMNEWSTHDDAWWWGLWTPGCMSGSGEQQPAAQALDSEASARDHDTHSGWGTQPGTLCPVVHCPEEMLDELMLLAEVKAGQDCLLDIGCGDGRAVLAAGKAGARGVGLDINPAVIRAARARCKAEGLEHVVQFEECDLQDLHLAHPFLKGVTIIYLYLLPSVLEMLTDLLKELVGRGVRIVTLDYHLKAPDFVKCGEALSGALRLYSSSSPSEAQPAACS